MIYIIIWSGEKHSGENTSNEKKKVKLIKKCNKAIPPGFAVWQLAGLYFISSSQELQVSK